MGICSEDGLPYTEYGNTQRLAKVVAGRVIYIRAWNEFLAFDGRRFVPNGYGFVERYAKQVARTMFMSDTVMNEAPKFRPICERRSHITAIIEMLKSEPGIEVTPDDLDADNYLLNCQNGTLDLRTLEFRPHNPADRITKITGADSFAHNTSGKAHLAPRVCMPYRIGST
jgi:putative DNA primase/helicase